MELPKKILVIRNDRLGDFMLAYPTFNVLKKLFPTATVYALVPEYTQPMAELCKWIDEVVIDDATKGLSGILKTTSKLKAYDFDAALCLHSSPRIALALFLAGIPQRFAPASRLDQIFYNHRLTQRRSRSEKPEYEYNVDLANFMGTHYLLSPTTPDGPPYLSFPSQDIEEYRQALFNSHNLEKSTKIVIVHAGSGGSAVNLSIDQYAELIKCLSANKLMFFVLTAGPGEDHIVQRLSASIDGIEHITVISKNGLKEFSKLLNIADLFISGSTGVLHISGALDTPTAAFYPLKISATSERWKTLNTECKHTAFSITEMNPDEDPIIDLQETCRNIMANHFSSNPTTIQI